MNSKVERGKHFAATWLYRWQQATGVLGAVLSVLTFAGVFVLLLGPVFSQFGFGYSSTFFILMGTVAITFLGFGFLLDRVLRFWTAQSKIGTIRNPWLYDRLYVKEFLNMQIRDLVEMKTLRSLAEHGGLDSGIIQELDKSIERLEETVRNRKWTVKPGENVYDDSD